jgi:sterol desaturase/sphingolipid hydroxylase (fatty acid hydroxylase superfamily)
MWFDIQDLLIQSSVAVYRALDGLLWPLIFGSILGVSVKRMRLFTDVRRALPETSLNLQIMVFNAIFLLPVLAITSTALANIVNTYGLVLVGPESWATLPSVAVITIAIVIGDFTGYWRHRLEHTALLWPSHAVHHSDTEMTLLTLQRFHPINRITTFLIDVGVLLILGFPPYAVFANSMFRHYYGYYIHADLPWTYGPLNKLFVSPAMHRWHHSLDREAFHTNFATVFGLWDWMFGTLRVPGPCNVPLGVTDDMPPTLRDQMLYAFSARAYRRLIGRSSTRGANNPAE